jgi:hypothetical protein
MPVCPECYLGVPSSFLNCPDCGGDLRVLEIEMELEPLPDSVDEIEILEPEPEPEVVVEHQPEPDPEPEPDADPEPVAPPPVPKVRPKTEKKKRSGTKPKSRPAKEGRRPAATVIHLTVAPEPEPPAPAPAPEPEPVPIFGELIGVLDEVAGFGQRACSVAFHEDAVVAGNEVVPIDAIDSASLTKIRFDLYRELTLTLKNGSTRTLRWLPEYNDDLDSVPLLREALGNRLTSFSATVKAEG